MDHAAAVPNHAEPTSLTEAPSGLAWSDFFQSLGRQEPSETGSGTAVAARSD